MRVGARAWIARILVTWGIISAAMMFVTGPWSFCILRILLGIAEAGFFPGIVFYLGLWFPARARARAMATFMAGGVVTNEHAQVLDQEDRPIPGLYATGNMSATVVGRTYPGAGASIANTTVFGYIAARHAAPPSDKY